MNTKTLGEVKWPELKGLYGTETYDKDATAYYKPRFAKARFKHIKKLEPAEAAVAEAEQ